MAKRRGVEQDGQGVSGDASGEQPENGQFRLHGDLLTTTLLAFLRNWNAYGYQLSQQLSEAGLPAFDSGTVYRTLRQLEKAGMVSSFWDTSDSGPARRMYSLTRAGDIFLTNWIDVLGRYQAVFRKTMEGLAPQARDAGPADASPTDANPTDEKPRAERG